MFMYLFMYLFVLGVEVLVGVFLLGLNFWNFVLKFGFGELVGVVEFGFVLKIGLFFSVVKLVKLDIFCLNVWGEKDRGLVVVVLDKFMIGVVDDGGGFFLVMKIIWFLII